jgi:hypothetical protein
MGKGDWGLKKTNVGGGRALFAPALAAACLALGTSWLAGDACAATEIFPLSRSETPQDLLAPRLLDPARTRHVGLDMVGYLYPPQAGQAEQGKFVPSLLANWKDSTENAFVEAGVEADFRWMMTSDTRGRVSPVMYFEISELYVANAHALSPVQLYLGRKLEHWSHLDEDWNLGLWQPRYRWDYIRPDTVALTGATVAVTLPYVQAAVWGSPIFIPERGVPIGESDGAFTSGASRWFLSPPATISILEESTPVRYNLELPGMDKILLNGGVSAMMRVGDRAGPWVSAGYAYKPMNQLLLATEGYLQLSGTQPLYADVNVYPRVVYHQLRSIEAGYLTDPFSATLSLLDERPYGDVTQPGWTLQQVVPARSFASNVDFRLAGSSGRETRLNLGYLRQLGGNADDVGKLANPGTTHYEPRYAFHNAVSVGFRSPVIGPLSASSRVLYDVGHVGAIWSTELTLQPRAAWLVGVGADLINSGADDTSDPADWIGRYRANDRVHAGVSYVF